jgi:hypothetical protein
MLSAIHPTSVQRILGRSSNDDNEPALRPWDRKIDVGAGRSTSSNLGMIKRRCVPLSAFVRKTSADQELQLSAARTYDWDHFSISHQA